MGVARQCEVWVWSGHMEVWLAGLILINYAREANSRKRSDIR